jgi:hypothetical protein
LRAYCGDAPGRTSAEENQLPWEGGFAPWHFAVCDLEHLAPQNGLPSEHESGR